MFKDFEFMYGFSKFSFIKLQQKDEEYSTKCFYSKLVKLKYHAPVSQGKLRSDFQISDKEYEKKYFLIKLKMSKIKDKAEFNLNF